MSKLSLSTCVALLCTVVFTIECAQAASGTLYQIAIRAVGARDILAATGSATPAVIDAALSDIRPQLSTLQYHSYHLLTKVERTVAENSSDSVRLAGGQVVRFRPVRSDGKRIGLWLKWDDANGAELLNTQLHLLPGHQMLTGVEGAGERGVILAIAVSPLKQ